MALPDLRRLFSRRYRIYRLLLLYVVFFLGCIGLFGVSKRPCPRYWFEFQGLKNAPKTDISSFESHSFIGRHLLNGSTGTGTDTSGDKKATEKDDGTCDPPAENRSVNYPPELFTCKELQSGAVILYALGLAYMFIALAIVCDEFFVPALGVITDKLKISEDVAGATFMAAGGSAPELFTSLIGNFIAENDVGIGTIVGSAVFNILFVIGMCSFFSKGILALTWWPLFRDVNFYTMSLIVLICFFEDNYIEWYEALVLFFCYLTYVTFMKFNPQAEMMFKKLLGKCRGKPFIPPEEQKSDTKSSSRRKSSITVHPLVGCGSKNFRHRKSIAALMYGGHGEHHGEHNPDNESGMVPDSMNENKAQTVEQSPPPPPPPAEQKELTVQGNITSKPPSKSSSGGFIQQPNSPTPNRPLSSDSRTDPDSVILDKIEDPTMDSEREKVEDVEENDDDDEDDNSPLEIKWPSDGTCKDKINFIIVFPLVSTLYITTPDVRREGGHKWYIVTFVLSIIWIGFYSFLMVWWAETIGWTIKIPTEVMGLTILAAGTSVPDLITSVIVAKKGHGDMAVSSSVGSNIFDITIGLPVPWMLYCAAFQKTKVRVESTGLFCSIMLLVLMLVLVVLSIAFSGWKMHHALGFVMMLLYAVFLACAIVLELKIVQCKDVLGGDIA